GPTGAFSLGSADGGRLQYRPQRPLGGDRMFANELPIARGHAAKVLRPRPVDRAVDADVSEFPGAELLRIRRKCEVGVDLPRREQPLALGGGMLGEGDVLLWIQPDVSKHAGQEDVCGLTQLGDRDSLP